ncbi:2'-5' RNA ligase family protein [Rhodoligotrophos defluvii]|uniref:2'-5' RNA ligase family protein n=1 Tax=Rhodoligotrophos defluvii TaxID=2561934 RepID=UPI0010C9DC07|nr:2'-5' RNA ligase family protein [Rhodoligotrophos defluvii]
MLGITIRASLPARPFWQLVDLASSLFEREPSIAKLGYAPHLTLARYDQIDPARLVAGLDAFDRVQPMTLVFDRICVFDVEPLVLWLSPRQHPELLDVHARLHAIIGEQHGDPHYLPGVWRPHCTIASAVLPDRKAAARRFAEEPIEPLTLTFDSVDALEWPPVAQIATRALHN